jgi:hypothetical protein
MLARFRAFYPLLAPPKPISAPEPLSLNSLRDSWRHVHKGEGVSNAFSLAGSSASVVGVNAGVDRGADALRAFLAKPFAALSAAAAVVSASRARKGV